MPSNAMFWLDIKRDVENKILSGEYKGGTKLPTILEFAEMYGVGRSTAQKVLFALQTDGLVVSRGVRGCFVKPFVREKMLEARKTELAERVKAIAEEIALLGIDKQFAIDIINKV